uniref:C-type lectin domain-containing protein n=1 Tax=Panagrolaimus sp. JU765 TaxID=591449 RepID=A0AC34RCT1_9BILA
MLLLCLIAVFGLTLAGDRQIHCPSGTSFSSHDLTLCFTFNSTLSTFDEAEGYCTGMGGHLAAVHDVFTSVFLAEYGNWDSFWIGGYQVQGQNSSIWAWKWYDAIIKYSDWDKGQPDQNYQCVALDGTTALWQSQPCSAKKPFVCQIPPVIDVCDSGWTYYYAAARSCYKVFNANNTYFSDAEASCVAKGGHLASIRYGDDNDFVRQLVASPLQSLANTGVWIGYNYPNGWTDGMYTGETFWYNSPSTDNPYSVYIPDGTTDYTSYPSEWLAVNSTTSYNRYICKKLASFYPYVMKN